MAERDHAYVLNSVVMILTFVCTMSRTCATAGERKRIFVSGVVFCLRLHLALLVYELKDFNCLLLEFHYNN